MKTKIWSIFGLAAFVIALALPVRAENTLPASLDALFAHGVKFTVSGYTNANGTVRSTPLQNFPVLVQISETAIPGFHMITCLCIGSLGSTISPMPPIQAAALASSIPFSPVRTAELRLAFIIRENGTSAPTPAPISISSLRLKGDPIRAFTPSIHAAAFPLPPAIPAETGSFLSIVISNPSFTAAAPFCTAYSSSTAATPLNARLLISTGIVSASVHKYTSMPPIVQ